MKESNLMDGGVRHLPAHGSLYDEGISFDADGKLQYSGYKVAILGESHYVGTLTDDVPELTQNVIRYFLNPTGGHEEWMNTYTKFTRALLGDYDNPAIRNEIWNHISFYNFIQQSLSGPRKAPTLKMFKDSEAAFNAFLDETEPDFVIAWGKRLYNNLPKGIGQGEDVEVEGEYYETWNYATSSGKTVRLLAVRHPSSAFSWKFWHKVITAFIK